MARSFVDHRWDSPRKLGFAPDSPLEGDGFEPSVPVAREPAILRKVNWGDRRGSQKNFAGYRWFESISLQRGVRCELDTAARRSTSGVIAQPSFDQRDDRAGRNDALKLASRGRRNGSPQPNRATAGRHRNPAYKLFFRGESRDGFVSRLHHPPWAVDPHEAPQSVRTGRRAQRSSAANPIWQAPPSRVKPYSGLEYARVA